MSKKKPLPKYLEGTIDCKQGLFEPFFSNCSLLQNGLQLPPTSFAIKNDNLHGPNWEEKLKSTEGRGESCPLQCRRQLLRDLRSGQVGQAVEPGPQGAPQVVHRTRLRGTFQTHPNPIFLCNNSFNLRCSMREDLATTANWSPAEWTRPSSCGTLARGVRLESTGGLRQT